MDLVLREDPRPLMRTLLLLCLAAAAVAAQESSEPAAYSKVCRAREAALRLQTEADRRRFEEEARSYLAANPEGERAARVRRWLDQSAPGKPPALEVEGWVKGPAGEAAGQVRLLVFFSVTHPQTAWLLPRVVRLRERLAPKGVAVTGIAAVVDDYANQTPALLEERLRKLDLPFPVAIDRQRKGAPSATFQASGGLSLPWVLVVDRSGRVVWRGEGGDLACVERAARDALARPDLAALVAAARRGDAPVADIAALRTRPAADALFELLGDPVAGKEAAAILDREGPPGFDLADPTAAAARWRRDGHLYEWTARGLRRK